MAWDANRLGGRRMKTAASPAEGSDNKAVQEEGEKKEKWVSDEVLKCS
jgi:hypothetical protein